MERNRDGDGGGVGVIAELDWSNWINIGILCVTALAGILSWLGARTSAIEANSALRDSVNAARKSAEAAEESARLQAKIVEIEQQRSGDAAIESRMARLHAVRKLVDVHRFDKPEKDSHLSIINTGKAAALNVEILIDGRPVREFAEFGNRLPQAPSIGTNGHLDLPYVRFSGGSLGISFQVHLSWDDDSGVRGSWTGTIC